MNRDIDDPRWTAYLLGDLDKPEQAEAEARLAADPDLKRQVKELGETLDLLREALGGGGGARALDPLRKERVRRAARTGRGGARLWIPTAAAALLAIGFGLTHYLTRPEPRVPMASDASEPADGKMDMPMDAGPAPAAAPGRDRGPPPMAFGNFEVGEDDVEAPEIPMEDPPSGEVMMEGRAFWSSKDASAGEREENFGDIKNREAAKDKGPPLARSLPSPTPTPTPTPEPESNSTHD